MPESCYANAIEVSSKTSLVPEDNLVSVVQDINHDFQENQEEDEIIQFDASSSSDERDNATDIESS